MITKTGIVRITEERIEAANFTFDCGGTLAFPDRQQEAIKWAIERLESELDTPEDRPATE